MGKISETGREYIQVQKQRLPEKHLDLFDQLSEGIDVAAERTGRKRWQTILTLIKAGLKDLHPDILKPPPKKKGNKK